MGCINSTIFGRALGISRAVLAARLSELAENGILEKHDDPTDGRASQYRLTEKGADLWPIIVAMLNWSNKHVLADGEDVVRPINPDTNQLIEALCARDSVGNVTPLNKMVLRTGASASPHLSARITKAFPSAKRIKPPPFFTGIKAICFISRGIGFNIAKPSANRLLSPYRSNSAIEGASCRVVYPSVTM